MEWETLNSDEMRSTGLSDGCSIGYVGGEAAILRDGKPVVRYTSNHGWQRPKPEPEPLFYVEEEYRWVDFDWIPERLGPVPKLTAEKVRLSLSDNKWYRNVRMVPAAPREMWAVVGRRTRRTYFVCNSESTGRNLEIEILHNCCIEPWNGKDEPQYGYLYATRQGA